LGQNFLVDLDAMQRIVDALGEISQTTVIEIGPGEAALTELLAKRAGRLIAVELDRVLAAQLRMRFTPLTNVEILEADILQLDLGTVLGQTPGPLRDLRPTGLFKAQVVGNLPYYITTDILLKLFSAGDRVEQLVLMVQKEVADRIVAAPGSRDYGLLALGHRADVRHRPEALRARAGVVRSTAQRALRRLSHENSAALRRTRRGRDRLHDLPQGNVRPEAKNRE